MKNIDNGLYKIGVSKDPLARARQISNASGQTVKPVKWIDCDDAKSMESALHLMFKKHRKEGEWFDIDLSILLRVINLTCNNSTINEIGVSILDDNDNHKQLMFLALAFFVKSDGYTGVKIAFRAQGVLGKSIGNINFQSKTLIPDQITDIDMDTVDFKDQDCVIHFFKPDSKETMMSKILFNNCISKNSLDLKVFVGCTQSHLDLIRSSLNMAEQLGCVDTQEYYYLDLSGFDLATFKNNGVYDVDYINFDLDCDRFLKL